MKVLLVDIDSTIPNLALKKIEYYYQQKGAEIIWNNRLWLPIADKIYVSCIFTKNKDKCKEYEGWGAEIGGTGYDIKKKLPDEIERMKPKINMDFATRGCNRRCSFCFVPEKEGRAYIDRDLYDIWDGVSKKVKLLDNNILWFPKYFKKICQQARKEGIKIDFNQGLDIRLLTNDIAKELDVVKPEPRFAWDHIRNEKSILRGIEILRNNNIKRSMFYVLVGFDTTIEDDLYRLNKLKTLKQRAYCMRYEKVKNNRLYNDLASWVNQQQFFMSMDFKQYQRVRNNRELLKFNKQQTVLELN